MIPSDKDIERARHCIKGEHFGVISNRLTVEAIATALAEEREKIADFVLMSPLTHEIISAEIRKGNI